MTTDNVATYTDRGESKYNPPRGNPLKEARIAIASAKLHSYRLRSDLSSQKEIAILRDILDTIEAIARSLEGLNSLSRAAGNLVQLPTSTAATVAEENLPSILDRGRP